MRRLIRSALNDIMPPGNGVPGILDADWDLFVKRFKEEASPTLWAGLVAGSVVYTISPIATVHVPLPSFALPARLRDEHAERITQHRSYLLRQSAFLLKFTAGFAWGAHPDVRSALNLEPYPEDPTSWREE